MFEVWGMMTSLLDMKCNFLVKTRKYKEDDLIAQTIDELNNSFYNNEFIENTFFYIIKYRFSENKRFMMEKTSYTSTLLELQKKRFKDHNKINFKRIILKIYHSLFSSIIKKQKYTILRSYLGVKDDLKLNFKLKQLPVFISNIYSICKPDFMLRKKINLSEKKNSEFEQFLYNEIFSFMPVSFLEGFKEIEKKVNKLNLPQKPKKIFSSNILNKNLLTRYCAHKVEMGAKLLLGTHGGCYGHFNIHGQEDHERQISNLYLTYGWKDKNDSKVKPLGMTRPLPKFNKDKKKFLLTMILPSAPLFNACKDSRTDHIRNKKYIIEPCFKIIDNLNDKIKFNDLLIRTIPRNLGMGEEYIFKNRYPDIKIDSQNISFYDTLSNTKIFLSPYIGTGFLETLALDIPTIVTGSINRHDFLRKEVHKYYQLLKEAKIYFDDEKLLAEHVNSIWNNHEEWWNSNKVQEARNIFCNEFAYININKVNRLKELLTSKHD